ncbi:cyclophilin-like domain-containing protein [Scenedesmus sp. NREL 46B-D3]|nr:cyclophilin-like domain-containing protein [Scenedesmus sp. NREL 46B-D3]
MQQLRSCTHRHQSARELNVRAASSVRPRTRQARTCCRAFCSNDQRQHNASLAQQVQNSTAPWPAQQAASLIELELCSSSRRRMLASAAVLAGLAATSSSSPAGAAEELDLTITDRIYLDIGVASSAFKPANDRMLGDKNVLPTDAEPAGRIIIGLYGKLAPVSTANIVHAVEAGAFTQSAFSRISPGEYIQAGRRGSRRLGDIAEVSGLAINTDLASPGPFKLTHSRPGTVSLSLSENDEDPGIKDRPDYRALEFLITTGPGPVPRLDGLNPVIGRVESGMNTVIRLSQLPSFQPDIRSQQLNRFAKFLGDDRADNVRRQYGKPLKAIIILDSGVL